MKWHSLLTAVALGAVGIHAAEVIPLTPDRVINLSGVRPASELIDEQALAGDPLGGKGGAPKTVFGQGWENKDLDCPRNVSERPILVMTEDR